MRTMHSVAKLKLKLVGNGAARVEVSGGGFCPPDAHSGWVDLSCSWVGHGVSWWPSLAVGIAATAGYWKSAVDVNQYIKQWCVRGERSKTERVKLHVWGTLPYHAPFPPLW